MKEDCSYKQLPKAIGEKSARTSTEVEIAGIEMG